MTKEERKQLYRTDIKEYKRLKRIEWYEDNQEWKRAEERKRRQANHDKRQTEERKANRAKINMKYRDKKKNKVRPLEIEKLILLMKRKKTLDKIRKDKPKT
jgi:hypothetical protein